MSQSTELTAHAVYASTSNTTNDNEPTVIAIEPVNWEKIGEVQPASLKDAAFAYLFLVHIFIIICGALHNNCIYYLFVEVEEKVQGDASGWYCFAALILFSAFVSIALLFLMHRST